MTDDHRAPGPGQAGPISEAFLRALVTAPPVRVAFVFAHADDSVLCTTAGLLAASTKGLDVLVCGGEPPAVAAAPWDQASGFALAREAHRVRLAEHARSSSLARVGQVTLDLLDSQYDQAAGDGGGDAGRWRCVVDAAEGRVRSFGTGVLVSHREDAWHPDHRDAARLASLLGQRLDVPVVQVCDRPYDHCGPGCDRRRGEEMGVTIQLDPNQWDAKQQLLRCHRSQFDPLGAAFGPGWDDRERLGWECLTAAPVSEGAAGRVL